MFGWIELALVIMRVVEKIINYAHDNGLIDQGRREEIAATAKRIADKMAIKQEIKEKIDAMPIEQVDKELVNLEPPATDGPRVTK